MFSPSVADQKIKVLERVDSITELCRQEARYRDETENEDAFCLVNLEEVVSRLKLWLDELPSVEVFYAVKSNSDPIMFKILTRFGGCSVDCASRYEIDNALLNGVNATKIINSHPCNSKNAVKHSARVGVSLMVFDCIEELRLIAEFHPDCGPILRIAIDESTRFGASDGVALMEEAKALGVDVSGISFYVGPGPEGCQRFTHGIREARVYLKNGRSMGHSMRILNIGGSFPGGSHEVQRFKDIAEEIRLELSTLTRDLPDLRCIAEPGKFFSTSPFTLCSRIMLAKELDSGMSYYLNQGIYSCFMGAVITNKIPPKRGKPLFDQVGESQLISSVLWGPTCDGADLVEKDAHLPRLRSGDWLLFEDRGAYSFSVGSNFNGFRGPDFMYVISEDTWQTIREIFEIKQD